jgi:hypothetical protein
VTLIYFTRFWDNVGVNINVQLVAVGVEGFFELKLDSLNSSVYKSRLLKVYLAVVFLGYGKSESLAESEKSILSFELELAFELIASNRVLQGEDTGLDIDIGLSSIEWLIFFEFFALHELKFSDLPS